MTDFPPRVTVHLGREYLLISAHEVETWSHATARENLLTVLREGIGGCDVRRLAERLGYVGEASDLEAIAGCVAEEIARGRLLPVALPLPRRGMRAMFRLDERTDDWSNAVPLASLSKVRPEASVTTWLEVRFVDPWWRPFVGIPLELELPSGKVVRCGLDGEARLRLDGLAGPRRACRAWIPADAAVPGGLIAGARTAETGRARRGGPPVELALATHNVIIVEVPHVPSW